MKKSQLSRKRANPKQKENQKSQRLNKKKKIERRKSSKEKKKKKEKILMELFRSFLFCGVLTFVASSGFMSVFDLLFFSFLASSLSFVFFHMFLLKVSFCNVSFLSFYYIFCLSFLGSALFL